MASNLQSNQDPSREPSFNQAPSAQEVFEQVMAEELSVFAEIQERALELTRAELSSKPISFQNRNSKANRMNENIKGLLFEAFPDHMQEDKDRRFYYEHKGYRIYFKKLNDDLMPMHVGTKRSKRILSQGSLGFTDATPVVFVGYLVNKSWDELKKLCAVFIAQGKRLWMTDLRAFGTGTGQISLFPQNPSDDAPLVVQPKNKKAGKLGDNRAN